MRKIFIIRIVILNALLSLFFVPTPIIFAQRFQPPITKPPPQSEPPSPSVFEKIKRAWINRGKKPSQFVDPAVVRPSRNINEDSNVPIDINISNDQKRGKNILKGTVNEIPNIPPELFSKLQVPDLGDPDTSAALQKQFIDLKKIGSLTEEQAKKLIDFYDLISNNPQLLDAADLKFGAGEAGIITVVFDLNEGWKFAFKIESDGIVMPGFIGAGRIRQSALPTIPKELQERFEKIELLPAIVEEPPRIPMQERLLQEKKVLLLYASIIKRLQSGEIDERKAALELEIIEAASERHGGQLASDQEVLVNKILFMVDSGAYPMKEGPRRMLQELIDAGFRTTINEELVNKINERLIEEGFSESQTNVVNLRQFRKVLQREVDEFNKKAEDVFGNDNFSSFIKVITEQQGSSLVEKAILSLDLLRAQGIITNDQYQAYREAVAIIFSSRSGRIGTDTVQKVNEKISMSEGTLHNVRNLVEKTIKEIEGKSGTEIDVFQEEVLREINDFKNQVQTVLDNNATTHAISIYAIRPKTYEMVEMIFGLGKFDRPHTDQEVNKYFNLNPLSPGVNVLRNKVLKEIERTANEEMKKKTNAAIDVGTRDLLKMMQFDLADVYDKYGGHNSRIYTRNGTLEPWPYSIPTVEDISRENDIVVKKQLEREREDLLKLYTPEDYDRLVKAREGKIQALGNVYVKYKNYRLFDRLKNDYGMDVTFNSLHQAEPGRNMLITKGGKSVWLDDYIKAGFPKTIE